MAKGSNLVWILIILALVIGGYAYWRSHQNMGNDVKYPTYCNSNEDGCTQSLCLNSGGDWRQVLTEVGPAYDMCVCKSGFNWIPSIGCDIKVCSLGSPFGRC